MQNQEPTGSLLASSRSIFFRSGQPRLKRSLIPSLSTLLMLLMISTGTLMTTLLSTQPSVHAATPTNTAAVTYKGDNQHTGQYSHETILNTSNVTVSQFGKRVTYPVDGQVYAQPLFVPDLVINGATHNVVFIATEHDSVYAFDADQTTAVAPLWHTSFLINGATTPSNTDVSCNDMVPETGITGTPVIDTSANAIYLVAVTKENGSIVDRLHVLDITTGADKAGSPTTIQATYTGTGSGSQNGTLTFNPHQQRQRANLLQANGQIYVAFSSYCDNYPYQGWIFGYTYNGSAFQQAEVYNSDANGSDGGIWGSGGALTADANGYIYTLTGNGDFNLNTNGPNAGDSFLKFNAQLQLQDYMTPFNNDCLRKNDADLGSGGSLLIPGQNRQIGGGKEGRIYVLDTTNMGKYTADPNLVCGTTEEQRVDIDKVLQEFAPGTVGGIYSNPSYWNGGTNGQYVYFDGNGSSTKAFQLNNGLLSTSSTSHTPESFGFTGGNAVISSNGTTAGTGIVWIIDPNAVLRAYDATNLASELYNSNQNSTRDKLDSYIKFTAPTVANGEVFVGTGSTLTIFGLLSSAPTPTPTNTPTPTPTPLPGIYNNIGISDDSAPGAGHFDGGSSSYSAEALQAAGVTPGSSVTVNGVTFTWPNVPVATNDNYRAKGQTIPVSSVSNATTLAFLGAGSGGDPSGTIIVNYTDGTTQTFTLGFSDWTLHGGSGQVKYGNSVAITTLYRNRSTGKQVVNTYVFYAEVAIPAGKTVKGVTLPTTVSVGWLHVFAIGTK